MSLGVTTQDASPELLVGDVFEGPAQQDGQVLGGLRVQDLQFFRLLFAWNIRVQVRVGVGLRLIA